MHRLRSLKTKIVDAAISVLQHWGPQLTGSRKSRESAAYYADAARRDIDRKQFNSAIFLAKAAILDDPTWRDGYHVLALAYQRKGDSSRARQAYAQGLEAIANEPYLLGALGDLEWETNNFKEAEASYQRALEYQTDKLMRPKVLLNTALAVDKQGRQAEAIELLQALLRRAPDYARPALALGEIYLSQNRFSEAVAAFQEGLRRDPGLARPHYDIAYVLAGQHRWQEALEEAQRAVALDATNADFQQLVADLQRGAGRGDASQAPSPESTAAE